MKLFRRKEPKQKMSTFHTFSGKTVEAKSPHWSCEKENNLVFELKEKTTKQVFELIICDICGRMWMYKKKKAVKEK